MNVSITLGLNKAQSLPYTAADLMRMSRGSQPVVKEKHPGDPVSQDRYYAVSANPACTYSPKGRMASRQKNSIGSQVDVRT
jgi:hypothetical protein